MQEPDAPTVDLVLATVDRTDAVDRLLRSLEAQDGVRLRVLVVDQNEDDRLAPIVAGHSSLEIERLRVAGRGLSRARNLALPRLSADVVAFPDDDCLYPAGLLSRVVGRLAGDTAPDGLVGRTADPDGAPPTRRFSTRPGRLDRATVWHRGNSASLFVRRSLLELVGPFDEELGLGGARGLQGEEVDWLIRALDLGAAIEYDPDLVVAHPSPPRTDGERRDAARRAGLTVGHLLRKHRYGPATLARMLLRPAGGSLLSVARRDRAEATARLATLSGRVRGYLDAGRAR